MLVYAQYYCFFVVSFQRYASDTTDPMSLAKLMKVTHADGFNGDTMGDIPKVGAKN